MGNAELYISIPPPQFQCLAGSSKHSESNEECVCCLNLKFRLSRMLLSYDHIKEESSICTKCLANISYYQHFFASYLIKLENAILEEIAGGNAGCAIADARLHC